MTAERPPRLKESAELGPLLRAADPPVTSPERLAANAAAVQQRIAAGVTTFAVWKLVVVLALVLAALVPLAWWLLHGERAPAAVVTAPRDAATAIEPDAAIATVIDASIEPDAAPISEPTVVHPPRGSAMHHAEHVVPDAGTAAPLDAESAPMSDLPEQIRIYEAARDASRRGDFDGALAQLDELMRRFPQTQLRADAELTRADVLARAGRLAEAAQQLEMLAADPAHRGRRGELLRTLGDLYRRLGDCPHALAAYTRAQAERLSDRDRAAVASGRARCE
jgi:tetratricopeptide (TPR) repeat protein